jgi:predicted HicB family RNase H-like nuclease
MYITLRHFMEAIDYQVNDGSKYMWTCYGPDARTMEYWNEQHDKGVSVTAVFDSKTQIVYEMEAWDYEQHRYYRWIHPGYIDAMKAECMSRGIDFTNAFDDESFIDLDVAEDILEKSAAMVAGEEYDTRVIMKFEIDEDLLFSAMQFAHEADITLNQYIENILSEEIARLAVQDV